MTLLQTKGFVPLCLMIFLNAFIDLGHKITIQNIIFKLYDGSEQIILTAIINALILLPFILFFAPAGKISDTFSKALVLRFTASSVLIISLLLAICYYFGWFWSAFGLTFLLAIQSAFYAPAKLGLVRELVDNKHLSKANGAAQALATMGVLFGALCFSIIFEAYFNEALSTADDILASIFIIALCLIALAAIETALSFAVPKPKAMTPRLLSEVKIKKLVQQGSLFAPVIGLTAYWSIGQMLLATYPAFAKETLHITNTIVIQALLALVAIGVMLGSVIAGFLSREYINQRLILWAGFLIIICLSLLPITQQLYLAGSLFLMVGIAGGLFIVPLMSTFQFCSEPDELGQNLANNNLFQFTAMTFCLLLTAFSAWLNVSAMQLLIFNIIIAIAAVFFIHKTMPHIWQELLQSSHKKILIKNADLLNGYNHLTLSVSGDTNNSAAIIQKILPGPVTVLANNQYRHYSHKGANEQHLTVDIHEEQKNLVLTIQNKKR